MTKYLIALVLWLAALPALAAAPVASLTLSRTSGPAPLCVHFDATGSTDADETYPFHRLLYKWDFGDSNAGVWARGSNTSRSKNLERGPVAGHCYETAGTYRTTLQVCDSTKCSVLKSQTITVTAPDTFYSGANTTCFYVTTVGSGCPAGATQTQQSSFNTALAACLGNGKRCLFKRGDTFTASAATTIGSAFINPTVGAYGSGAAPVVNGPGVDFLYFSAAVNGFTVMDLDFYGAGLSAVSVSLTKFASNTTNVTLLRVGCYDHGGCFTTVGNGDTNRATGLFVVDSNAQRYTRGNAAYIVTKQSAFMGNVIDDLREPGYPGCPLCSSEHGLRFQYAQKTIVSHNYFGKASPQKHQLTMRGPPRNTTGAVENDDRDSTKNYVADNYFDSTLLGNVHVKLAPSGDTQCHWLRDFIFERNYIRTTGSSTIGVMVEGRRMSVRNNLHYTTSDTGSFFQAISSNDDTCSGDSYDLVNTANALPQRGEYWVYNNSIYHDYATANFNPILFIGTTHSITNSDISNNLVYSPLVTNYVMPTLLGTTTGTTATTNSNSTQAKTTNPFAVTPSSALTFLPATASYATGGGTGVFPVMVEDFFGRRDTTPGTNRIGALVPAARAVGAGATR